MMNDFFQIVKQETKNKHFVLYKINILDNELEFIFHQIDNRYFFGLYEIIFTNNGLFFKHNDTNGTRTTVSGNYKNVKEKRLSIIEEINEKLKKYFDNNDVTKCAKFMNESEEIK